LSELWYNSEMDILGVQVSKGKEKYWKSVEVAPSVVVNISKSGEITGFEILGASQSFNKRDLPLVISVATKKKLHK